MFHLIKFMLVIIACLRSCLQTGFTIRKFVIQGSF